MKLNIGLIWLIFMLGVGNLWIVDGYKCEFKQEISYPKQYICKVVPDSSKTAEKHNFGKTDDNVEKFIFAARFHNISHFTQSESTSCCQRFKNIKEMEITDSKLNSIDGNSLQNCKEIKKMQIQLTNIQEFPENLLVENTKLTRLWFDSNNLNKLPENIFANQMELLSLSMSYNPFTSLPPNIFKSLMKLQWLYLRGIKHKINPHWFQNLKNLNYLDLSLNKILDLPKNIFSSLESLETLKIADNQLTVIHSDSFGTLNRLDRINLYNNNVYAIDEKLIDNTNLSWLDMEKNNCSNVRITSRDGLKEKLSQCFNNYFARIESN